MSRRLYMHTHEHKAIRVLSSANDLSQLFIGALSFPNHQDADLLELPLDLVDDPDVTDSYPIRILRPSKLLHIENSGGYWIVLQKNQ